MEGDLAKEIAGSGPSPGIASKYKIVFIGDAFVGKTCLINRFIYDTFDPGYQVFLILLKYRSRSELTFCQKLCMLRIKP